MGMGTQGLQAGGGLHTLNRSPIPHIICGAGLVAVEIMTTRIPPSTPPSLLRQAPSMDKRSQSMSLYAAAFLRAPPLSLCNSTVPSIHASASPLICPTKLKEMQKPWNKIEAPFILTLDLFGLFGACVECLVQSLETSGASTGSRPLTRHPDNAQDKR